MDTKERYVKNDVAEFWIEDGILVCSYNKDLKKLTLDQAKSVVQFRIEHFSDKKYPIIIMVNNIVSMDKSCRKYFATEGIRYLCLAAYLVDNFLAKSALDLYARIYKYPIPNKNFTKFEKAKDWLTNNPLSNLN